VKKYGETYGLEKVLHLWEVERLTAEQAIGQILLLVRQLDERVQKLEACLREIGGGEMGK
jgi:hypothetical protein